MNMNLITLKDFLKVKIAVGTIIKAEENNFLKKPSIILHIDFGPKFGIKKSSAQLKENYLCDNLINKQILAVLNFRPKQIGNIISEVLVLGLPNQREDAILVSPDLKIKNGQLLY